MHAVKRGTHTTTQTHSKPRVEITKALLDSLMLSSIQLSLMSALSSAMAAEPM